MRELLGTTKLLPSLLVAIAITGYCLVGNAGNLEPSAGPTIPTMKTLDEVEPRIALNSENTSGDGNYMYTINSSGSYYLPGNVTTTKSGIFITADDVTIDLMGYTLKGPDSGTSYGVYMNTRSNVEIRNGTIRDFKYGIREANSFGKGHRIINVRAVSNGVSGIILIGRNNLIKNCSAIDNGISSSVNTHGIYAGKGSKIINNTACGNGEGATSDTFGIAAYNGCTVSGNTAYGNGKNTTNDSYGIAAGDGCTVSGNTACENGEDADDYAYGIKTGDGCTVVGNTAHENGYKCGVKAYGMYISAYSLVDRNTAFNNGVTSTSFKDMYIENGCTVGLNHAP